LPGQAVFAKIFSIFVARLYFYVPQLQNIFQLPEEQPKALAGIL
jgi:hypothetical protein